MGNCCQKCFQFNFRPQRFYRNITLLMVGLDDAGKTTIARRLIGESCYNVLPTVGFSSVIVYHRRYKITIYDLGGATQIRDIWCKYYDDVHGVIFVLDAGNLSRINEAKRCFRELLSSPKISGGKPVLILGNKQDKEDAMDEMDIIDSLNVEQVVNDQQCPTRVEVCSALNSGYHKSDVRIQNGYHWLIDMIIENYNALNERVNKDMLWHSLQVENDKTEWKKRRAERESNEENIFSDTSPTAKNGSHNASDDGENPFKPIRQLIENVLRPSSSKVAAQIENGTVTSKLPKVDPSQRNEDGVLNGTSRSINLPNIEQVNRNAIDRIGTSENINGVKKRKQFIHLFHHRRKRKSKLARCNKTSPMMPDFAENSSAPNYDPNTPSVFTVSSSSNQQSLVTKKVFRIRPKTAPPKLSTIDVAWNSVEPVVKSLSHSNDKNNSTDNIISVVRIEEYDCF